MDKIQFLPRGPRNLRVTLGAKTLTHYGGVYLIHSFLTRLGLKHATAHDIRVVQLNNLYSVPTRATSISSCWPTLDELMQTALPATGVSARHPSDSSPQDPPDADPVVSHEKPTILDLDVQRTEKARRGIYPTIDQQGSQP